LPPKFTFDLIELFTSNQTAAKFELKTSFGRSVSSDDSKALITAIYQL
jgi:hypothetical protein